MGRNDGFQIADIDVQLLRDPKLRALHRTLGADDARAAQLLYLAVILTSWETGRRVSIDDAIAFEDRTPERVAALKTDLLDAEGMVPQATWDSWFRPAWDRRERSRDNAKKTNTKRWTHSESQSVSHSDNGSSSGSQDDWINESLSDSSADSPSSKPYRNRDSLKRREVGQSLETAGSPAVKPLTGLRKEYADAILERDARIAKGLPPDDTPPEESEFRRQVPRP